MSVALGDVARFVDDNRELLVEQRGRSGHRVTQTLADSAIDWPTRWPCCRWRCQNLVNVHNAESGTLDLAPTSPDLQDPLGVVCKLIDLGKLYPGDPRFEQLGRQMRR